MTHVSVLDPDDLESVITTLFNDVTLPSSSACIVTSDSVPISPLVPPSEEAYPNDSSIKASIIFNSEQDIILILSLHPL